MFLCWDCVKRLKAILGTAAWLGVELDLTTSRQARITSLADRVGSAPSSATLMPFHLAASECTWVLTNTLTTWARVICESRGLDYPAGAGIAGIAGWLQHNVVSIALSEAADQAYDEIADAVQIAHRVIDRPPGRLYIGPCGEPFNRAICDADLFVTIGHAEARCPVCGATHSVDRRREQLRNQVRGLLGTAAELAHLLPWVLDSPITRKRITYYARKGFVSTRYHGDEAVYQIGEVIDAHIKCEARRTA
jgi:hypothetical protein